MQTKLTPEQIKIEYLLCNTSTKTYVTEIIYIFKNGNK
jgi:hypothetical protein